MHNARGIHISIDHATQHASIPSDDQLKTWAKAVLTPHHPKAILTIRLVDITESATLNKAYRKRSGPTNILTFCFEPPPGMTSSILGDIVLCPQLIKQEVEGQPPSPALVEAHWAHLLIHGCLHLIGYDHDNDAAANSMEGIEIEHLEKLGYPNPYK